MKSNQTCLTSQGAVVTLSEDNKPIYRELPTIKDIQNRIRLYHDGYHKEIASYYKKIKFIIDGHSMMSHGPITREDSGKERADIILGSRKHTTCNRSTTFKIKRFFLNHGFSISLNKPYQGKYIISHHCSIDTLPGIQIEFNRKLYMNEKTLKLNDNKIIRLNTVMQELVELLAVDFKNSKL